MKLKAADLQDRSALHLLSGPLFWGFDAQCLVDTVEIVPRGWRAFVAMGAKQWAVGRSGRSATFVF